METCLLFPTAASPTSKSLNRWSYGSACLAAMVKRANNSSTQQPRCTSGLKTKARDKRLLCPNKVCSDCFSLFFFFCFFSDSPSRPRQVLWPALLFVLLCKVKIIYICLSPSALAFQISATLLNGVHHVPNALLG